MILLALRPKVYITVSIAGFGLASSDYTQRNGNTHLQSQITSSDHYKVSANSIQGIRRSNEPSILTLRDELCRAGPKLLRGTDVHRITYRLRPGFQKCGDSGMSISRRYDSVLAWRSCLSPGQIMDYPPLVSPVCLPPPQK